MHLQMENTSILHRHLGAVVVSVHNHHIIIYWFYTFAKGEYKYIPQAFWGGSCFRYTILILSVIGSTHLQMENISIFHKHLEEAVTFGTLSLYYQLLVLRICKWRI